MAFFEQIGAHDQGVAHGEADVESERGRRLGVETRPHRHGLIAHAFRRELLQQRLQQVERHRRGRWCGARAQDRGLLEANEIGPQLGDLVGDHHGTFGRPCGQNVLVGQRRGSDDLARSPGGV